MDCADRTNVLSNGYLVAKFICGSFTSKQSKTWNASFSFTCSEIDVLRTMLEIVCRLMPFRYSSPSMVKVVMSDSWNILSSAAFTASNPGIS
ncbi:hypothetical protein PC116_g18223 [Phytophthora cactorum]|uniref:Uncharacterized protein n=1 Tax=Phytophthora cactorum TaxID=29920 RepID=A0A329RLQ9_9STRA|nr:hypothetical protein Pcac1_g16965 [Phytophthora cactorum]KAG4233592.1 hypothetical protein PC116_g18223 [Phytophthora cactorum]RAW25574.1 hypothetical protein PC110_g18010 [Phytophthora cactorum]